MHRAFAIREGMTSWKPSHSRSKLPYKLLCAFHSPSSLLPLVPCCSCTLLHIVGSHPAPPCPFLPVCPLLNPSLLSQFSPFSRKPKQVLSWEETIRAHLEAR